MGEPKSMWCLSGGSWSGGVLGGALDYASEDSPPWEMGLPKLPTEALTEKPPNPHPNPNLNRRSSPRSATPGWRSLREPSVRTRKCGRWRG